MIARLRLPRVTRGIDEVVRTMRQGSVDDRSHRQVLDIAALEAALPELRARYAAAKPFPHVVLDDFLIREVADRAIADFPTVDADSWTSYLHFNERKFANHEPGTWSPTLQRVLREFESPRFVEFLSDLTGIDDLFVDDGLEGAGLHGSLTGGYLNVHADFTVHPRHRSWRRRVNVLLYLNREWPAEFGGDLELWSTDMGRCESSIAPTGNRVVIFNTEEDSFHGHPEPLRCPLGTARQSMALYYFSEEVDPLVRSTEYRARPGDGRKGVWIYLDKQVLRAYDRLKRRLQLSDDMTGRVLRLLERLRMRPPQ